MQLPRVRCVYDPGGRPDARVRLGTNTVLSRDQIRALPLELFRDDLGFPPKGKEEEE